MIAIHTKYFPASNYKGSRIKAYTTTKKTAVISYPHEFSHEECHFQAVKALIEKYNLDWNTEDMRFGDSADGKGYVFCFAASIVSKSL
jgi:hypothetical protein